jgi:hypothetical protein
MGRTGPDENRNGFHKIHIDANKIININIINTWHRICYIKLKSGIESISLFNHPFSIPLFEYLLSKVERFHEGCRKHSNVVQNLIEQRY